MADLDALVEELGKLTILEAAELAKKLEEEWGVSAAAPAAGMMMICLLYTSPSPRDATLSRMPSSA